MNQSQLESLPWLENNTEHEFIIQNLFISCFVYLDTIDLESRRQYDEVFHFDLSHCIFGDACWGSQ